MPEVVMQVSPVGRVFALLLLFGLPLLAARTRLTDEQASEVAASRPTVYVSAGISTVILAGITWLVAGWQGIESEHLGWSVRLPIEAFAWAGGVTAAGLAVVWGLVRIGQRLRWTESRLAIELMPRTSGEKLGFLALSAVAAVGEEYLFRGYMQHVLAAWVGAPALVAVLCTVSFGLAHGYQRVLGVLRAVALGGLLALAVLQTGSLFPAIVAHFWINSAVGLGGWRWLFRNQLEA